MRSALWDRLYSDFLLHDRLPEYRQLLERAARLGYRLVSIGEYRRMIAVGTDDGSKALILRHDIDTDPPTAKLQFEIERSLGASASYFFRLSTIDISFMHRLQDHGCDVGYHYEELSSTAREWGLRSRAEVEGHLPEIRDRFRRNLRELRASTGLPLRMVAAHGDMVNRHLGMRNQEILGEDLRRELEIEVTADERAATPGLMSRFSDAAYPTFWKPHDPATALERGDAAIYALTHPRQWRRDVRGNLREDVTRAIAGLRYRRSRNARWG